LGLAANLAKHLFSQFEYRELVGISDVDRASYTLIGVHKAQHASYQVVAINFARGGMQNSRTKPFCESKHVYSAANACFCRLNGIVLIVDRGSRAREIEYLRDLHI
jgi:hypothetical protein